MQDIRIREAGPEDAMRMAKITAAAWQTAYAGVIDPDDIATRTAEYYAPKFQQRLAERQWTILLAEVGGVAEEEQEQALGKKKYKMVGFGFLLSATRESPPGR